MSPLPLQTSDINSQRTLSFTEKIQKISPKEAQTGPAVRGDRNVMSKQLELMNGKEDLQELYQMLSKGINPLVDNLTLDKR